MYYYECRALVRAKLDPKPRERAERKREIVEYRGGGSGRSKWIVVGSVGSNRYWQSKQMTLTATPEEGVVDATAWSSERTCLS